MKNTLLLICAALTISAASIGQTTSALRSDGVMLKNGHPFFPIGYYAEGFNTLTENNYAANTLSTAGFNMMFTEHDIQITSAEFSSFLDNCASKGIYNMLSFWDPSTAIDDKMRSFIPTYRNKPSVLAWCIGDDASTLGSESDILRKDNLAKSLDANHLTYESFNGTVRSSISQVGQSAMQGYPHFFSGDLMDGYGTWTSFVDVVNQCASNGKTPLANLQSYRWQTGTGFLYPTAAELDVEAYMAIVAGMKGLFFYTFKDDGTSTINLTQTALWNASVQVCTEIQGTLINALLDGTRTTTADATNHVYYAKFVYGSETYVIAVNVAQQSHSVSIPVTGTTLTKVFSYRNGTLSLNSNTLSGTLGAEEVQIYKVTSGGTSVVVNFEDRPTTEAGLNGVYSNIDWGSGQWFTQYYSQSGISSKVFAVYNNNTTEETHTFTLPAGKVLKSLKIATTGNPTTKKVIISSTGNSTLTWTNMTTSMTTYNTNWTVAAATVTVKITCSDGAAQIPMDDLQYGDAPTVDIVNFEDRPTTEAGLNGVYSNIDWGSGQWFTQYYSQSGISSKAFAVYNNNTTEETHTFTLPAGKVLKSLKIATTGNPTTKKVIISSTGNPTLTWTNMTTTMTTYNTNWTVATATVTVKITCSDGAAQIPMDDVTYSDVLKSAKIKVNLIDSESVVSADIILYPNPASAEVFISNLPVDAVLSAFTIDGKLILQSKVLENRINVSNWNKGIYLIQIKTGNGTKSTKLLIQ